MTPKAFHALFGRIGARAEMSGHRHLLAGRDGGSSIVRGSQGNHVTTAGETSMYDFAPPDVAVAIGPPMKPISAE